MAQPVTPEQFAAELAHVLGAFPDHRAWRVLVRVDVSRASLALGLAALATTYFAPGRVGAAVLSHMRRGAQHRCIAEADEVARVLAGHGLRVSVLPFHVKDNVTMQRLGEMRRYRRWRSGAVLRDASEFDARLLLHDLPERLRALGGLRALVHGGADTVKPALLRGTVIRLGLDAFPDARLAATAAQHGLRVSFADADAANVVPLKLKAAAVLDRNSTVVDQLLRLMAHLRDMHGVALRARAQALLDRCVTVDRWHQFATILLPDDALDVEAETVLKVLVAWTLNSPSVVVNWTPEQRNYCLSMLRKPPSNQSVRFTLDAGPNVVSVQQLRPHRPVARAHWAMRRVATIDAQPLAPDKPVMFGSVEILVKGAVGPDERLLVTRASDFPLHLFPRPLRLLLMQTIPRNLRQLVPVVYRRVGHRSEFVAMPTLDWRAGSTTGTPTSSTAIAPSYQSLVRQQNELLVASLSPVTPRVRVVATPKQPTLREICARRWTLPVPPPEPL